MRWFRAIEMEGYKFIWASDGRHELYNLRADPDETKNLIKTERERAGRMAAELDACVSRAQLYDPALGRAENAAPISPGNLERLRQLGYISGADDEADGASDDAGHKE